MVPKQLPKSVAELVSNFQSTCDTDLFDALAIVSSAKKITSCDIFHWKPILDKIDEFFEEVCTKLKQPHTPLLAQPSEGVEVIVAALKATEVVLSHAKNVNFYGSLERLCDLLSVQCSTLPLPVLKALRAFIVSYSFPHYRKSAPLEDASFSEIRSRLLTLSTGYLDGNGIAVPLPDVCQEPPPPSVSGRAGEAFLEFYSNGRKEIDVRDLSSTDDTCTAIASQLAERNNLPSKHHFALLHQVRLGKFALDAEQRRTSVMIQLYSSLCLHSGVLAVNTVDGISTDFDGFLDSVISVLKSDAVEYALQEMAIDILICLLNRMHGADRSRVMLVYQKLGCSSVDGVLPTVARKALVTCLESVNPTSNQAMVTAAANFMPAICSLLREVASTNTGSAGLTLAGLVPFLLRFVEARKLDVTVQLPAIQLLCLLLKPSQGNAVRSLQDLGGGDALIQAILYNISQVQVEAKHLKDESKMEVDAGEGAGGPSPVKDHRLDLLKALLKSLLHVMASPSSGSGYMSSLVHSGLTTAFKEVLSSLPIFGSNVCSTTISIIGQVTNAEPASYSVMEDTGLFDDIIALITKSPVTSSSMLLNVPTTIVTICLKESGVKKIVNSDILAHMLGALGDPELSKKIDAEVVVRLGLIYRELCSHHPEMMPAITQACYSMVEKIIETGEKEESVQKAEESNEFAHHVAAMVRRGVAVCYVLWLFQVFPIIHPSILLQFLDSMLLSDTGRSPFSASDITQAKDLNRWMQLLLRLITLPSLPLSFDDSGCSQEIAQIFASLPNPSAGIMFSSAVSMFTEVLSRAIGHDVSIACDNCPITALRDVSIIYSFAIMFNSAFFSAPLHSNVAWKGHIGPGLFQDIATLFRRQARSAAELDVLETSSDSRRRLSKRNRRLPPSMIDIDMEFLPDDPTGMIDLSQHAERQRPASSQGRDDAVSANSLVEAPSSSAPASNTLASSSNTSASHETPSTTPQPELRDAVETSPVSDESKNRVDELLRALSYIPFNILKLLEPSGGDSSMRKAWLDLAETYAKILLGHFDEDCPASDWKSPMGRIRYYTFLCVELYDLFHLKSSSHIHTALVYQFWHAGGLARVLKCYTWLMEQYRSSESSSHSQLAAKGLEQCGRLLEGLADPAMLVSRTARMMGPEVDLREFMASVHIDTIVGLKDIITGDSLLDLPVHMSRTLFSCIRHLLNDKDLPVAPAEGDRSAGPFGFSLGPPRREIEPDQECVSRLIGMGFTRAHAEEGLRISHNDIQAALSWMLSHPQEAPPEEGDDDDDELALALALSLGQDGDKKDKASAGQSFSDEAKEEKMEVAEKPSREAILEELKPLILPLSVKLLSSLDSSANVVGRMLKSLCEESSDKDEWCETVSSSLVDLLSNMVLKLEQGGNDFDVVQAISRVCLVIIQLCSGEGQIRKRVIQSKCMASIGATVEEFSRRICLAPTVTSDGDDVEKETKPNFDWMIPPMLLANVLLRMPMVQGRYSNGEKLRSSDCIFRFEEQECHSLLSALHSIFQRCDLLSSEAVFEMYKFFLLILDSPERCNSDLKDSLVDVILENKERVGFDSQCERGLHHLFNIAMQRLAETKVLIQQAMECEIVHLFKARNTGPARSTVTMRLQDLMIVCAPMVNRDADSFMAAIENVCQITNKTSQMVSLKSPLPSMKGVTGTPNSPQKTSSPRTGIKRSSKFLHVVNRKIMCMITDGRLIRSSTKGEQKCPLHVRLSSLVDFWNKFGISDIPKKRVNGDGASASFLPFLLNDIVPYDSHFFTTHEEEDGAVDHTRSAVARLLGVMWDRSEGQKKLLADITTSLGQIAEDIVSTRDQSEGDANVVTQISRLAGFCDLLQTLFIDYTRPDASHGIAKFALESRTIAALMACLKGLDLDHPYAPKVALCIMRPLEVLTRVISFRSTPRLKQSQRGSSDTSSENTLVTSDGTETHDILTDASHDGTDMDVSGVHSSNPGDTVADGLSLVYTAEDDVANDEENHAISPLLSSSPSDSSSEESEEESDDEGDEDEDQHEDDDGIVDDYDELDSFSETVYNYRSTVQNVVGTDSDESSDEEDEEEEIEVEHNFMDDMWNTGVIHLGHVTRRGRSFDHRSSFRCPFSSDRSSYSVPSYQNSILSSATGMQDNMPGFRGEPLQMTQQVVAPQLLSVLRNFYGSNTSRVLCRLSSWTPDGGVVTRAMLCYAQSITERVKDSIAVPPPPAHNIRESLSSLIKARAQKKKVEPQADGQPKQEHEEQTVGEGLSSESASENIVGERSTSEQDAQMEDAEVQPQSPVTAESAIAEDTSDSTTPMEGSNLAVTEEVRATTSDEADKANEERMDTRGEEAESGNSPARGSVSTELQFAMDVDNGTPEEETSAMETDSEAVASGDEPGASELSTSSAGACASAEAGGSAATPDEHMAEFLAAMPDDIREEVLAQQRAQQEATSAITSAVANAPPDISSEYLDALPPEIQQEVLAQVRAQQAASAAAASPAAEMDGSSIIATMPEDLRQELLVTMSDNELRELSADLQAEARVLRERNARRFQSSPVFNIGRPGGVRFSRVSGVGRNFGALRGRPNGAQAAVKSNTPECTEYTGLPLVDDSALLALARLLYLARPLPKNTINKIMFNLCANATSREHLLSMFLQILCHLKEEEKPFPMIRAKSTNQFSPLANPCHPMLGFQAGERTTFHASLKHPPVIVIRRCLEILTFVAEKNSRVRKFCFTSSKNAKPIESKREAEEGADMPCCQILLLLSFAHVRNSADLLSKSMALLDVVTSSIEEFKRENDVAGDDHKEPGGGPAAAGEDMEAEPSAASSGNMVAREPGTTGEAEGQPSGATTNTGAAAAASEASKAAENGKETVGPSDEAKCIPCPTIPHQMLAVLPRVLTSSSCRTDTYDTCLRIVRRLCSNADNKLVLLQELRTSANHLVRVVVTDLNVLEKHVKAVSSVEALSLMSFPISSAAESSFLRLLTLINTLSPAEEKTTAALDVDDAWSALEDLLISISKLIGDRAESETSTGSKQTRTSGLAGSPILRGLLPLIESYLMLNGNAMDSAPFGASSGCIPKADIFRSDSLVESGGVLVNTNNLSENQLRLYRFITCNRSILNELIREDLTLIDGSFKVLTKFPTLLDFDNKRDYFRQRVHPGNRRDRYRHPDINLSVRRDAVFQESFNIFKPMKGDELKGRLNVRFDGEEGIDAGGVMRDWYSAMARAICNPDYALFTISGDGSFQPNRHSGVLNPDHIDFFKFCGRVIAKAIYDGALMEVHFTRAVYKRMVDKKVSWKDLEVVDPEYFKNLSWILTNNITDVLDLTFSLQTEFVGQTKLIELKPDGKNIQVTESNKEEYVQLVAEQKVFGSIEKQIEAFCNGFHELIPLDLIHIFNENELELLISGMPDYDVEDLRAHTEYRGYTSESATIRNFWTVMRSLSQEDKALFIQFVTGSAKVPLEGFNHLVGMGGNAQRFQITRTTRTDQLPAAHTW